MPKSERSRRTRGPAKLSKDMKEVIHLAFERAGGVRYLVRQAEAEPKAFMGLLGRIVPNEVRLDVLVALDLGQAIRDNQRFLESHAPPIDVTPSKPATPLVTEEK
jgi:hypothetical protein